MESMELKIIELSKKGIGAANIAKVYDLERKDVSKVIFKYRQRENEDAKKKSAIEKIMAIAKVEEAIAEKILAAVKEAI